MSKRPVVCFLTGTLEAFAGAERVTALVANTLAQRGWSVHILSLWGLGSYFPLEAGIRHTTLFAERPSFKSRYLHTVRAIRRYVRDNGIDVLVGVDTMLAAFTLPACAGLPVRQYAWEHCHFDQDLGRRSRRLARRLAARYFAGVVVLTERDRQRWLGALRPRRPIVAIPNPLPFRPADGPEAPVSGKTVLAVGRLVPEKGFDVLMRAWAHVARQQPEWRLRIVGEGESRPELEQLRRALGLDDIVALPGATAEIEAEYRRATLFCLSSRYEGFGMVLIEAMAAGLPVVSTDCETGPREILRDRQNALLAPAGDSAALADRLVALMADEALQDRLRTAGRVTADAYLPERIAAQWEALLDAAHLAPDPSIDDLTQRFN